MTETKPKTSLVKAVAICLAAVLLTTSVLWTIGHLIPTEHLVLGYLLLIIFIAIFFGGILAFLTTFACGLTAAYFLLPPTFSFYIEDPMYMKQLVLTMILSMIAVVAVDALARGRTEYSSWGPP